MSSPVLEIRNLTLAFNPLQPVVRIVNLRIHAGEVHGVIGESGSGKSLTALSVVRLQPPACKVVAGEIQLYLAGRRVNVLDLPGHDLLSIRGGEVGFVFQDPMTSLNPSMRCGHQVMEMIRRHRRISKKGAKKKVEDLFEKVRLPNPGRIFSAYPHEISGGQRQRVMIAMAISCNPRLLIADEPTTALDVTVQKSLISLIDELRRTERLAVLFISHDLNVISDFADTVSIMYRGEIVESARAEEVFNRPVHPYTKGLLACRPPLHKRLDRLPTVEEFLTGVPFAKQYAESRSVVAADAPLIEVNNLEVYYAGRKSLPGPQAVPHHVLKDVSFRLYEGQSLGLLGESGSGKTTLGKAILHLIDARSGSVRYRGNEILTMPERRFREIRRKIQFVFQDPYASLNPKITAGEAIAEAIRVHDQATGKRAVALRTTELLEMVGLRETDAGKFPHAFSGGQRQRIVIARALSVGPECLICDEAVSALDVSVQAQILNLLSELKTRLGLTFLFITHDLGVVRFFCDGVLVMESGLLVESGETEKVFDQPQHPFTKKLLDRA